MSASNTSSLPSRTAFSQVLRVATSLTLATCIAAPAVTMSGCASPGKRTGIGAGAGALGGAAIGGVLGGWKGAAIGGAIGAATGGGVGNYLDKQAQELEKVAETKRTDEGVMVKLKNDVLFDTGKAEVKDQARTQLSQVGAILAKYPQDRIRVAGYTDSTGKTEFNKKLSEERAQAVKAVLVSQGVKEEQLMYKGFGEDSPAAGNDTAAGRAKNRRVELNIDVPEDKQT
jgi:outer membrane protein OmpA-like peptidoglycan-associated protein